MASGSTPKLRFVRCPKCRNVLEEPADVPVYQCGGCDTVLQAKNRKSDAKSTSSGPHDTDDAETNNLDHVSEDNESSSLIHSTILPYSGECSSLDENNERNQNIPGDCNNKQLEAVNLSNEDQNNGSDQNEPCNRNIERPGVCNEVCSSADLAYCGSEELPPIAGAHSEVEGNDESPPLPGAHSEEEVNDESPRLPGAHSEVEANDESSPLPGAISEVEVNDESPPLPGEHSEEEVNDESSPLPGANSEVEVNDESPPLPGEHSEEEVNGESSPLPGANSEVEVNDESPPLAGANSDLEANNENSLLEGAKSEADINNESYSSFIRSSNTDNLVATMGTNSTVTAHRPAGESISSDTLLSSPSEPLEQRQNSVHHGFARARSTDSLDTTEFASPRSEFSGTLEYLSKCPTTRSSHAYDGSVSSYDGVDDQFPDRHRHSFKNAYKAVNSVVSEKRLKRDKFLVNRNPEVQQQARKFSSVLANKKHYSTESSQWDQDELLEPARHGHPVRNWPGFERDEYQSQVPFYQRGSLAGYESGSTSSQFHDEFHRNSRFHSPDKPEYTEQDKMKLLRMVCELQDQLNKTCHLNGMANGRVSSEVSRFYNHEASEEDIYQDLGRHRYPGRLRQGSNWPQQSKFSQIPFSGEAINSRHQMGHSCSCCHPQDWQCSAQLPPPVLRLGKGFCRVHPCHSCYNSYSSCPSSPQRHLDSEFPIWSRESKSCDQRHKDHEVKKYLREKQHLVKRHLRPTAGGAPFITCYCCLKPLQLPADFLLFKRRCHQLRCGSCSEILKFSLKNRTHIVRYTLNAPPPSEVDDFSDVINSRSLASASHANNCPQADPVSCSDDYGLSFCKSCSTDGDPVSLTPFDDLPRNAEGRNTSNVSGQRKEFVSKQSRNKGKNPVETYESAGPSSKVSSEIEELPPRGGSPLHRLMGYSSPSEVIYGAGPSGSGSISHNRVKVLRSRN